MKTEKSNRRRAAWIALVATVFLALAVVAAPVWIVQPFKPQNANGLELSYALRRWSPLLTLVALFAALVLVIGLWRGARRRWRRVLLLIILLPIFPATWFARQNHFEWMFRPLPNAAYTKAADVSFINDTDMILAIENGGEAVAYPVRLMAYHHVVQDTVGGEPIVATY